jgi:hypothetical protein
MAGERTARTGPVARWVLLACTLLGLAAMHSLGHAGIGMDGPTGHRPAAPASMVSVAMAVTDGCAGCAHPGDPAMPGHGGMSVWSVCLAVLGALALAAVLAALLLAFASRHGTVTSRARTRPATPRAPPARRTGLNLAAVSVLRL